jgi:hypothetical protein
MSAEQRSHGMSAERRSHGMSGTHRLRPHLPAIASVLVLALLWLVQTVAFAPLASRYRTLLAATGEMGASLDPGLASAPPPPRVGELLRKNSVTDAEANHLSQSGFLATDLMRRLSEAAHANGIEVAGSEPGVATQTPTTVEIRAHLKLRCHYDDFVSLLAALAGKHALYRIERMAVVPRPGGGTEAEIWVAQVLLKRGNPS